MKGVVLAGGFGTRLAPMTKVVNKHLLDVFDQPMVHYPIRTLAQAGIDDVVLVTGAEIEQFQTLLGDGSGLGVRLTYVQQEGAGGIAEALALTRSHVGSDSLVAILGDNLFQDDLAPHVAAFRAQGGGARCCSSGLRMPAGSVWRRSPGIASCGSTRSLPNLPAIWP